ncbi:MAG: hypothetical protein ACK559_37455, partial [bacterium]
MNSSSSDDQLEPPSRIKRWRKRRAKPNPPGTAGGTGDSATAVHHTSDHWERKAKSDSMAELAAVQKAVQASRWACPVNGHSGHTLDTCR